MPPKPKGFTEITVNLLTTLLDDIDAVATEECVSRSHILRKVITRGWKELYGDRRADSAAK